MLDRALAVALAAGVAVGVEAQSRQPTFEVTTVKINNSGAARPGHTVVPPSGQVTHQHHRQRLAARSAPLAFAGGRGDRRPTRGVRLKLEPIRAPVEVLVITGAEPLAP